MSKLKTLGQVAEDLGASRTRSITPSSAGGFSPPPGSRAIACSARADQLDPQGAGRHRRAAAIPPSESGRHHATRGLKT